MKSDNFNPGIAAAASSPASRSDASPAAASTGSARVDSASPASVSDASSTLAPERSARVDSASPASVSDASSTLASTNSRHMVTPQALRAYAVTDRKWTGSQTLFEQVELALKGGATFVQLREKTLAHDQFLEEAKRLKPLCREYDVPFVINDNVEIALAMDADGVHVGQSDMEAGDVRAKLGPDKIIGVSAQTVDQALLAQSRGADYLGVGAVFPTGSKDDAVEVPLATLQAICQAVDIPVVAIGGITATNLADLAGTGICGVAVISAIFGQPDITAAAADLKSQADELFGE